MSKIPLGPMRLIYPMPVILVGTNVDDKPNFMTVGWCGNASVEPPIIHVAIRPRCYTHRGIRQNLTFSVNVPSVDLIREIDYCGMLSGSKVNKVEACQFSVFYGKLGNAPLIDQCPINLESKVLHILELGDHSLFVGRIEESYISENCLTEGKPDISKIKPLIFVMDPTRQYQALGEFIAKAFSVGKELKTME